MVKQILTSFASNVFGNIIATIVAAGMIALLGVAWTIFITVHDLQRTADETTSSIRQLQTSRDDSTKEEATAAKEAVKANMEVADTLKGVNSKLDAVATKQDDFATKTTWLHDRFVDIQKDLSGLKQQIKDISDRLDGDEKRLRGQ